MFFKLKFSFRQKQSTKKVAVCLTEKKNESDNELDNSKVGYSVFVDLHTI